MRRLDLDDLRALVAVDGEDYDARVIAFYAWQDATETVAAELDDRRGAANLVNLLVGYMTGKFKPIEMAEVEDWVRDFQDPDAIGGDAEQLKELVEKWLKHS